MLCQRRHVFKPPHHAFAVHGRRREEATCINQLRSHKCRSAGLSSAQRTHDVINAFAFSSYQVLDARVERHVVHDFTRPRDVTECSLVQQDHRHSSCSLNTHDDHVVFVPRAPLWCAIL